MATRAIISLIQQTNNILDQVAPQIKEEANKKIIEIKQKIPTEDTIRQMVMDEINSRGSELVCSIEIRERIDFIYNKMQNLLDNLKNIAEKSQEKLQKLEEQLTKIGEIVLIIKAIFKTLKELIPVLNTVVQVAKVGINFLKGLAADGATTVKLKDLIDKSKDRVEEIKNSVEVFEKKIAKIKKAVLIPAGILTLILTFVTLIKNQIKAISDLLYAYYVKYELMCDNLNTGLTDEEFLNENADPPIDISDIPLDDLSPGTIERIRNAQSQVIQYRIA